MVMGVDSQGCALGYALQRKGWRAQEYSLAQALLEDMKPLSATTNKRETMPEKQSGANEKYVVGNSSCVIDP